MAIIFISGAEAQEFATDNMANNAGTTYSTTIKRTGAASWRCNVASGGSANFLSVPSLGGGFMHFGFYAVALPSAARVIFGINAVGTVNVRLNTNGTIAVYISTTLIGTSTQALVAGVWYWLGIRTAGTAATDWLQVDGVAAFSASGTTSAANNTIGPVGTEAAALDCYYDDVIFDNAGFIAPSNVAILVPTADSAVGTGWTLGTGTAIAANSGSTAVKNRPPLGVADLAAGSDVKQIRNASANASVSYDATLTTYTAAGINSVDTVLAVWNIVATAAPVTTSSKQGLVGMASNPAITTIALAAGGTAGAFWAGAAGGTYPTGWKASFGTLTLNPSVTLGTAPVARVTQVTSSTRIAVVAFLAAYVAWTPGFLPYVNPMPPLIAQ